MLTNDDFGVPPIRFIHIIRLSTTECLPEEVIEMSTSTAQVTILQHS